ncbi:MAG: glycosyltransferase family 39 protein [Anaerolineae bacterium]|nr:glycosyltransferase family 39 protein [Anaerolineae bacterium]
MIKHRWHLSLVILLAFGLRLAWLDKQSLWYDEGVTWLLSQMNLADMIEWTAADIQPPLYYLLIWVIDIFLDDSEWILRFPSAVFNTLTIPVLYALARYLTPQPDHPRTGPTARHYTGLAAVTIFAISPVMVYYSQEARMYTLLVFEATLASLLLLNILHPVRQSSLWPPIFYALTATAALYTHYFAAFLLIGHGLYALFVLHQRGWSTALSRRLGLMFGLTGLLFGPWLATLLARLGDDPSYWPGALKLNEAVRKVFISFVAGETVIEQTGFYLSLALVGLLVICGIWYLSDHTGEKEEENSLKTRSGPNKKQNEQHRPGLQIAAFLLLWLLLPIILILVLSYQSPKFNPRYTLLSYPAFTILLAIIIAKLRPTSYVLRQNRVSAVLSPLLLIYIIATSAFSLTNWFTDRRFSKDDFRAMAQFVEERIAPDETVLLSSGHLFPVWAYYAGWENWTPLPWMQRLDVRRVTTLEIATEMQEGIAGKAGVWLVTWQDEVIDPSGVVPFWLDRIGERPQDAGDFWGVGLEHWRINPKLLPLLRENPIDQPANLNFADQLELVGSTQLNDTDLALFWRPRRPLQGELVLSLDLTDGEGHDWDRNTLVEQPGAGVYPPSRWPVGEIIMTRHVLPWQIGTPPGLYIAEIGLGQVTAGNVAQSEPAFTPWDILDSQGRPQRRTALIDFINLSELIQPQAEPLPVATDPEIDFLPIVAGRRVILPETEVEPGDRILLAILWQAGEYNYDNVSISFDLIDSQEQLFRVGSSFTPSRRYNLPRWQEGEMVLGQYWLDIPPQAAPGPAKLQLHLVNSSGFVYDELFPLDELMILPTERTFSPPQSVDVPVEAKFGDQASLIGLDCRATNGAICEARPGETLELTLYWRAETAFDKNYTVFTHVLQGQETIVVNADHAPPKPTQGWVADEVVTDPVSLTLPTDLAPGSYALEIGLYDAADPAFTRLPLPSGDTRVLLPDAVVIN